jgi:4-hydroxybenzoate polyprenyltransferase
MKKELIKKIFKIDQLILILSLGYLGLLFAGRVDFIVWLLLTLALISGNTAKFLSIIISQNRNSSSLFNKEKESVSKMRTELWIFQILSCALLVFSAYLINDLCYYLSILAVILLICFYLLRKFNLLTMQNIGVFEAVCPIAGFIAVKNRFELIPFILFFAVLLWISGLEISYSIHDNQNDRFRKNIFVERFGGVKARGISITYYIFSLLLIIAAGLLSGRGMAYWIAILCFAIILLKQGLLLKNKDAEISVKEFLQINNLVGPALFIGSLIDIFFSKPL